MQIRQFTGKSAAMLLLAVACHSLAGDLMPLNQARVQARPFAIIGRYTVAEAWHGEPLVLQVNQNANMPQTPNGSVVLTYLNQATQNNFGSLSYVSGGSDPKFLDVPALTNQPGLLVNNWHANNLSITNVSANMATPIQIQAVGPGMPGTNPKVLPIGSPLTLKPGETAQTDSLPQWMQVVFQSNTSNLAIFALIGPQDGSGNNAYVIQVNASNTVPPGYYASTSSNSYTFQFRGSGSVVFVANLSALTSPEAQITLRKL